MSTSPAHRLTPGTVTPHDRHRHPHERGQALVERRIDPLGTAWLSRSSTVAAVPQSDCASAADLDACGYRDAPSSRGGGGFFVMRFQRTSVRVPFSTEYTNPRTASVC